jgi:hypothetical protein
MADTSVESYKHKFAKHTLAGWLRNASKHSRRDNRVAWCPLYWRVNRDEPYFGVLVEYPICLGQDELIGLSQVWDERLGELGGAPPTYDACITMGLTPFVIFDIVILHKGAVGDAIEVVHRNGIDESKMQKLQRIRPGIMGNIWQIGAEWILCQVEPPTELSALKWVL